MRLEILYLYEKYGTIMLAIIEAAQAHLRHLIVGIQDQGKDNVDVARQGREHVDDAEGAGEEVPVTWQPKEELPDKPRAQNTRDPDCPLGCDNCHQTEGVRVSM